MSRWFIVAFVAMLLAACSAGRQGALPAGDAISNLARPDASGSVYVANWYGNDVAVYGAGGKPKLRTITNGVEFPNALTVDTSGALYVGNFGSPSGSFTSSVSVYGAGHSGPSRIITDGVRGPFALAVHSGKLYVANYGAATVTIYARGSTKVQQTLFRGMKSPEALAFDHAGNLFVANWGNNSVTVYASDKGKPIRTIKLGISAPDSLAFDSNGSLYVANHHANSVTIYAPGQKSPAGRIKDAVRQPLSVISSNSNLYVLNYLTNTVTVYDEATLKLIDTISKGIACPSAMAMSGSGLLYVANTCPSGLSVYSQDTLQRTVTGGLNGPVAIGIAP